MDELIKIGKQSVGIGMIDTENKLMSNEVRGIVLEEQKENLIKKHFKMSSDMADSILSFMEKLDNLEKIIKDSYETCTKEHLIKLDALKKTFPLGFEYIFDAVFTHLVYVKNATATNKTDFGHVYIIKFIDKIKIGSSIDPNNRIRTIETMNGDKIQRFFISDSSKRFRKIESGLHKKFKTKRTIGEYFKLDFDLAVNELKSCFL